MAQFCMATGLSPDQYRKLTRAEYLAFIEVLAAKQ